MITYPLKTGYSIVTAVEFDGDRLLAATYNGLTSGVKSFFSVFDVLEPELIRVGSYLLPLWEIYHRVYKSYCLSFGRDLVDQRTTFSLSCVAIKNLIVTFDGTWGLIALWGSRGKFYAQKEDVYYCFEPVSADRQWMFSSTYHLMDGVVDADLMDGKSENYSTRQFANIHVHNKLQSLAVGDSPDIFAFSAVFNYKKMVETPVMLSCGKRVMQVTDGGNKVLGHVVGIANGKDQSIVVVSTGGLLPGGTSSVLFVSHSDGRVQRRLDIGEVFSVDVSPDKSLAAFGGDGKVTVIDMDW